MKRLSLVVALVLGLSVKAFSQFCPGCVQNSATEQNAQLNITSATIRGLLHVGSINVSSITVTTATAAVYYGSATYLTNLNASQLLYGAVPSVALSGSYPGITSIGMISSGIWNGNIITSQYGGTGANLVTANPGSIPYFSSVGTMSALAPATAGFLLQTNGASPPSWTGAPQVLGTNITAIPLENLIPGELPSDITINDASISTVSAAKVIGNIPGNANNIYGILPIGSLGAGTFNTSNPASSVTASGVIPGIYGGPNQLLQATVGYDGRITAISQSSFTISFSSTSGPLPPGITIGAAQVTAGTLGPTVIASSVAVSGVVAGSYGIASQVSTFTVGVDGRLTNAGQIPIAISPSQINSGTLPGGVSVPAANIQAGVLAGNVIASSVAATGIGAGTYGAPGYALQLGVGGDGRILSQATYLIPGTSTSTTYSNVDNAWSHSQTFFSSITVNSSFGANFLAGNGSALTSLNPASIASGVLSASVIASSVAATGVVPATYGSSTQTAQITIGVDGRVTAATNIAISASAGISTGVVTTAALTGNGNSTSPLGVNSSSVAVFSTGGNLVLPYGVSAGSASLGGFSVVGGSGTFTYTVQASTFIGSVFGTTGQTCQASGTSVVCATANGNTVSNVTAVNIGGNGNSAGGLTATVLGGQLNSASGNVSLAAGSFAFADGEGSSVWADDSVGTNYHSHSRYTWNARANNGFYLDTTSGVTITSGSLNVPASSGTFKYTVTASTFVGSVFGTTGQYCTGSANPSTQAITCGPLNGNASSNNGCTISGGTSNSCTADYGTIPGGNQNLVSGGGGFAAGINAQATHVGSFVWSDNFGTNYFDHGTNTFNVRANGGIYFDTTDGVNITSGSLNVKIGTVTAYAFSGIGSSITAITAANISSGTLGAAVIASSVAASGVTPGTYGSFNQVPQLTIGVDGRVSTASTVTISAGISTGVVTNASLTGNGNSSSPLAANSSSVTLQGNTFNGANQLVQLLGNGFLPVLNGSNLTNVTAASVAASSVTPGSFQNAIYTFPTTTVVNGLSLLGSYSAATIRTTACSTFVSGSAGCMVYNATDFDMYTSTAASAGSWRNSRTGTAP